MDIKISHLSSDTSLSLRELQMQHNNKPMVIDFWHTKCSRCPAALEKLNNESENHSEILFVSCALSQGVGNKDIAADLSCDWNNLTHIWMDLEEKEQAKKEFNFTSVPFYVVVGRDGIVIASGEPKTMNYVQLLKNADENVLSNSNAELVLDAEF